MRLSRDTLLGVGAWNMYNNSSWKRKIWRSRKSTSSRNINDNSCWSVMYTKHYTNLSKGLEIAKDLMARSDWFKDKLLTLASAQSAETEMRIHVGQSS